MAKACFRGEHCFLEEDDWLACMRSCTSADEKSPNQSESSIRLFQILVFISGLLCDCGAYVIGAVYDFEEQESLLHRVDRTRNDLMMWYSRWGSSVFTLPKGSGSQLIQLPVGAEYEPGKMLEVFCAYEAYLMICNRLYVALGGNHSVAVELQSQTIARDLLGQDDGGGRGIAHGVRGNAMQECLILTGVSAARAILSTADDWASTVASAKLPPVSGRRNVASPDVFRRWIRQSGFAAKPSKGRVWEI